MHNDYVDIKKRYPLKWYLQYPIEAALAIPLMKLLQLVPMNFNSWLAGKALRLFGPLHPVYKLTMKNLEHALPELKGQHRQIALDSFESFGRVAGEMIRGYEFNRNIDKYVVEVIGTENLQAMKDAGKGGIFCVPHMGNWEIMAAWLAKQFNIVTFYRRANNPYMEKVFQKARNEMAGSMVYLPKGQDTMKPLMEHLLKGWYWGAMCDQRLDEGIAVPFFGQEAMTTPLPASLHLKYDLPIQVLTCKRLPGWKVRFSIRVSPLLEVPRTGDYKADQIAVMTAVNKALEHDIRLCPGQYFWQHNRWNLRRKKK
ncbi:MAG: lysophospholipid acyltransferase family protein [Alphaproteobacteria bacterium]|nr:lysophospholipid acyltransferase family protein [Alphaproteobacteria bacterium]